MWMEVEGKHSSYLWTDILSANFYLPPQDSSSKEVLTKTVLVLVLVLSKKMLTYTNVTPIIFYCQFILRQRKKLCG